MYLLAVGMFCVASRSCSTYFYKWGSMEASRPPLSIADTTRGSGPHNQPQPQKAAAIPLMLARSGGSFAMAVRREAGVHPPTWEAAPWCGRCVPDGNDLHCDYFEYRSRGRFLS